MGSQIKINEELLANIIGVQFLDEDTNLVHFDELENLDDSYILFMILICNENKKFKLGRLYNACLTVKEAKLYVKMGIPEYSA